MRLRAILLVAVGAGLLATLAIWCWNPRQLLVERLDAELQQIPDEDVALQLRQLDGLGHDGLAALVAALDSQRSEVAATASQLLKERLAAWQKLPTNESSPLVAKLAELLAAEYDGRTTAAPVAAGQLATRLLLWPIDRSTINGARLVDNCAQVLRVPADQPVSIDEFEIPELILNDLSISSREIAGSRPPAAMLADRRPDVTPSPESASRPMPDEADGTESPAGADGTESRVDDGSAVLSKTAPLRLMQPEAFIELVRPTPAVEEESAAPPHPLTELPSPPADLTSPVDSKPLPEQLRTWEDFDVIQALRTGDSRTIRMAEEELRRRGYGTLDLRIAKQVMDPDPAVRRQLAERLPGLSGTDVRGWLLWLARDDDPDVRRTATSIIATSADPALHTELRKLKVRR